MFKGNPIFATSTKYTKEDLERIYNASSEIKDAPKEEKGGQLEGNLGGDVQGSDPSTTTNQQYQQQQQTIQKQEGSNKMEKEESSPKKSGPKSIRDINKSLQNSKTIREEEEDNKKFILEFYRLHNLKEDGSFQQPDQSIPKSDSQSKTEKNSSSNVDLASSLIPEKYQNFPSNPTIEAHQIAVKNYQQAYSDTYRRYAEYYAKKPEGKAYFRNLLAQGYRYNHATQTYENNQSFPGSVGALVGNQQSESGLGPGKEVEKIEFKIETEGANQKTVQEPQIIDSEPPVKDQETIRREAKQVNESLRNWEREQVSYITFDLNLQEISSKIYS